MNPTRAEPAVVLAEDLKKGIFDQNVREEIDEPGAIPVKYRGTPADRKDMNILGKKQVLMVYDLANLISRSKIHQRNDWPFV